MRIDLWVPTASPFATPELLAVVGRGGRGARRRHHLGGRARGAVRRVRLVLSLRRRTDASRPRPGPGCSSRSPPCRSWPPTPPRSGWARPWCSCPSATRCTRPRRWPPWTGCPTAGSTSGIGVGWLEEEFDAVNVPVAPAGPADRRVPRGAPHPVVRRDLLLRGRVLLPRPVPDVPQARPAAPSAHPHRRREPSRPGPGGPGRPGLAHLQPAARASWPSRWPGWTGCWPSRVGAGRTSPSPSAPTSSPSTPTSPAATPSRGRRGGRPAAALQRRRRDAGPRRPAAGVRPGGARS